MREKENINGKNTKNNASFCIYSGGLNNSWSISI